MTPNQKRRLKVAFEVARVLWQNRKAEVAIAISISTLVEQIARSIH